jgi:hypothetical protein
MAISNAIFSHNNKICPTTKFKPIDIFNNNQILEKQVIENTKNSQKNLNKNKSILEINTYVIVSNYYIKKGNSVNIKFGKKGKKTISGIVVGKGSGSTYPIRISKNIMI